MRGVVACRRPMALTSGHHAPDVTTGGRSMFASGPLSVVSEPVDIDPWRERLSGSTLGTGSGK